jgi:uncharacterized protein YbjT (DUF2867 family)
VTTGAVFLSSRRADAGNNYLLNWRRTDHDEAIATSAREFDGDSMNYLITGATGNVGARVTEQLIKAGERPRLLVRDESKARSRFGDKVDVFTGDLAEPSSLASALAGVDALFLLNTGPDIAAKDEGVAKAARAAGVKRLVKLSSLGTKGDAAVAIGRWHALGEAAIAATGIPWTSVRPGMFMSNSLMWATMIRTKGAVFSATGEGKIAPIHPDDIAAVVCAALTRSGFDGKVLEITGPEALSHAEMTAKIAAAIGRPLVFQPISDEDFRSNLLRNGAPPAYADGLVAMQRLIREGEAAVVTPGVSDTLGRPALRFDAWAAENARAFL